MKAIILAAGRGSRMKDMTDDRPKCLVELRGKPLLDWQLIALRAAGISEIGIVTGYRSEMLVGRVPTAFFNHRWESTNMVSSLACAREWLLEAPCLVSYSDIFYSSAAVRILMESQAKLAITYDPAWLQLWEKRFGDPLLDAETFRLKADGITLAEIGNKPRSIDEIQGQYMGLLRFTPAAWSAVEAIRNGLPDTVKDRMHMTGTLQKIIESGELPITALPYHDAWGEIDSADDLAAYTDTSIKGTP